MILISSSFDLTSTEDIVEPILGPKYKKINFDWKTTLLTIYSHYILSLLVKRGVIFPLTTFIYLLPLTKAFAVDVAGVMKLFENAFSWRCFLLLLHSELFEIAQEGVSADADDVTEEAVEITF